MLKVLCVMKASRVYNADYVVKLERMVRAHLKRDFEFVCLTDRPQDLPAGMGYRRLREERETWWAKTELFFDPMSPCLYFDLDTLIVDDITPLADAITEGSFFMLKPFHRSEKWASGVMAWQGDFSFLTENYEEGCLWQYRWDQRYIVAELEKAGVEPQAVQDFVPGVVSYKHHCRPALPEKARIVCFHGRFKPNNVHVPWVQDIWTGSTLKEANHAY